MFVRRIAQTVGVLSAVAFCSDTGPQVRFQRQNSSPEKRASFADRATSVAETSYQLYKDTDWIQYQTEKVRGSGVARGGAGVPWHPH